MFKETNREDESHGQASASENDTAKNAQAKQESVSSASSGPTDAELRAWVETMVHKHQKTIRRYARKRLQSADADDVTQIVLMKLWEQREVVHGFRHPIAWIMKITRREVSNVRRFHDRRPETSHELPGDRQLVGSGTPPRNGLDAVLLDERERAIRAAIESLSDELAEVFLLHQVSRLTHEEIAEVIETTARTARWRYSEAFKRVREQLGDNYRFED